MLTQADLIVLGYSFPYFILFMIACYLYYMGKESFRVCSFYLAGLAIFVGIADMLGGYDRYIYAELFDEMASVIRSSEKSFFDTMLFKMYQKEIGYCFFNLMVGLFTQNRYIFILISTIFIYYMLAKSMYSYIRNYPMFIILFLGFMFFFTFTYLRQIMAICIAWASIKYAINGEFRKFSLIVLLATLFHNSAILFLIIYFVPVKKYSIQSILSLMMVCFAIGLSNIAEPVFSAFGFITNSEERVVSLQYMKDVGANYAYIIQAIVFLFFILRNYSEVTDDRETIFFLNIALLCYATLLLFVRSENGGRLSWIFLIGVFVILSDMDLMISRNRYGNYLIILCFLLFFRVILAWRGIIVEYKTFFTPGHRPYDYIYEKYEYDKNYDTDKLYKL